MPEHAASGRVLFTSARRPMADGRNQASSLYWNLLRCASVRQNLQQQSVVEFQMLASYFLPRTFLLLLFLFFLPLQLCAQSHEIFTLTATAVNNPSGVELDNLPWRYHAGDDMTWAEPQLDDSSWEELKSTTLRSESLPRSGWNGIGWFRLHLLVDPLIVNKPLGLVLGHWGASEIYVDGMLVKSFGVVGTTKETEIGFNPNGTPAVISFGGGAEHVIAIRHSVMALRSQSQGWGRWLAKSNIAYMGFLGGIQRVDDAVVAHEELIKLEAANRFGRAGILLTLALLFMLLFFFYRLQRANLFFSLFAFCVAVNVLGNYIAGVSHYDITTLAWITVLAGLSTTVLGFLFLLLFLYAAFSFRIPKYFWLLLAGWVVLLTFQVFALKQTVVFWLFASISLLSAAESVRVVVKAFLRRLNGAWIIGLGVLMVVLLQVTVALYPLFITLPEGFVFYVRQIGPIGVAIAISIYLARNFAHINKHLEAQLKQVKELSEKELEHERYEAELKLQNERERAENERRATELQEARELQLSMLPKSVPQLHDLEIAVYMKPATEVGGDYYDFHISDDGTLTVAIGDATGHGLKAGTVVTATKSLFNNLASEADIAHIFKQSSNALKKMNLRGLYMAMTMLKIKDGHFTLSAAGMPSTLIYRAATREVEEIVIRAMPLGSFSNVAYQQLKLRLSTGDCVVVMTDGFPERFNQANEILGYDKAQKILREIAEASPQEIVNRFVEKGEEWAGGRLLDDDVTFVVLKVKDEGKRV
jgi:serine phosphatase RsbU (regulator of sigma subunit)